MRFSTSRNYCPECGEEINLIKTPSGAFCCTECGCEFTHNWRAWLIIGVPISIFALVAIVEAATLRLLPQWVHWTFLALSVGAIWLSPDWYSILKHGRLPKDSRDETDAA